MAHFYLLPLFKLEKGCFKRPSRDKFETYQKNKDQTVLAGITKHDITGAMIQAGVQSYFAINQAQDTIAAKQHGNVIKTPFLSYGSFATYVHPT